MNLFKKLKKIGLWRKAESGEKIAVKNYKEEKGKESNEDVEHTFLRDVEALFTLKHPFILSLKWIVKGYCISQGKLGPELDVKLKLLLELFLK
jgi:hypothetical protein